MKIRLILIFTFTMAVLVAQETPNSSELLPVERTAVPDVILSSLQNIQYSGVNFRLFSDYFILEVVKKSGLYQSEILFFQINDRGQYGQRLILPTSNVYRIFKIIDGSLIVSRQANAGAEEIEIIIAPKL